MNVWRHIFCGTINRIEDKKKKTSYQKKQKQVSQVKVFFVGFSAIFMGNINDFEKFFFPLKALIQESRSIIDFQHV